MNLTWQQLLDLQYIVRHPCSIPLIRPYWGTEEDALALSASRHLDQDAVERFIAAFRAQLAIPSDWLVVPTSSGRSALQLLLKAASGLQPTRRKVVLPSYSCRGLYDPIVNCGLTPVFVDIRGDLLADSEAVVENLTSETLACLFVNLGGKQCFSLQAVSKARDHQVLLIGDECQSVGGQTCYAEGRWALDAYIYSFGMGKNLMATGGGTLCTNRNVEAVKAECANLTLEPIANALQRYDYYRRIYFHTHRWEEILELWRHPPLACLSQYSSHWINPLDAALMVPQLSKLREIIEKRRAHAMVMAKVLGKFSDLFRWPNEENHIFTKFSLLANSRHLLRLFIRHMHHHGIGLEKMYTPLHLLFPSAEQTLPITEDLYTRVINLPVRPNLRSEDVSVITEALCNFGQRYG